MDKSLLEKRCAEDSRALGRLRVEISDKVWLAPMIDIPDALVRGADVDTNAGASTFALLELDSQASVDGRLSPVSADAVN